VSRAASTRCESSVTPGTQRLTAISPPSWRDAVVHALALSRDARWTAAGGGLWTQAWRVEERGAAFFVKIARERYADAIAAEADGLRALADAEAIVVPRVIGTGASADIAFLALDWLDLHPPHAGAALGRALAALHRVRPAHGSAGERFGWHRDNWIGGTPQANAWRDDWAAFFRDARLAPQLALAAGNGYGSAMQRDGERLLAALPTLLRGHDPAPSLLHGDLWSGNAATLADGTPIVFDPAVYVGDREADLAMTELFGGFGADFLAAYREGWPLDDAYPLRRTLYNLYHVLNHLNLFGEGYLSRARREIAWLLAQAG